LFLQLRGQGERIFLSGEPADLKLTAAILRLSALILGIFRHREAEVFSRRGRGVEPGQQPSGRLCDYSLLDKSQLDRARVFGAQQGGERCRIVSFGRHAKLVKVR